MAEEHLSQKEVERVSAAMEYGAKQEQLKGDLKHPVGGSTGQESPQMEIQSLKSQCNDIRYAVGRIGEDVLSLKLHPQMEEDKGDRSEMIANVMLAYRHLEDARMRLGKVIQAFEGGISIYDKEKK